MARARYKVRVDALAADIQAGRLQPGTGLPTHRELAAKERLACVSHPASYFVWLPLGEEVRADQVAAALMRKQISVSTAEPFATSAQVPHAIRLALGSISLTALQTALEQVKWGVGA